MKRFSWRILALVFTALPAFAGSITYDCDPSLQVAECTTLTTTIAGQYATYFTNANATIYVTPASLSGEVADNVQIFNTVNYFNYYAALKASESGPNDVTGVNSLGSCGGFGCLNPVTGSSSVNLTGPLESALGLGTPTGICFLTSGGGCLNKVGSSTYGSCTIGISNSSCYNDILDVGNSAALSPNSGQYDFVTAVEHETDEALGTSSCLNVNQGAPQNSCGSSVSAADLFRYSASGTRSFLGTGGNQAKGTLAYFSIDGGTTNLVDYNNTNNGDDYGDFLPTCAYVQDAVGCPGQRGLTIGNDGGLELALLDATGYSLTPAGQGAESFGAPEPSSIAMVLGGAVLIVWMRRRRTQACG